MRRMKWVVLGLGALVVAGALWALAGEHTSWLQGTVEEQLQTLAAIQPGLGTVMIEYSNRMGNMYYAAQAKNWGMAAYQLKEAVEIQEVGETTRPSKADLLKAFEESYLKPLAESIVNQDFNDFQNKFNAMVQGCNNCHQGTGHRYIVYRLPDAPLVPAQLDTGQTFTKEELQQILSDLLGEEE